MATSGWQSEQTWFTYSSHIRLVGNIRIDGITHTGTNLRIWGAIAGGARGDSNYRFYYSDYTSYAQPEGGSKIALGAKGKTWKVGDSDTTVSFDVTLSNVSASTTSRQFYVNFYGPNTNSVVATLRWNLSFDASGNPPGEGHVTLDSRTWNTITATSSVQNWGGTGSGALEAIYLTGSSDSDFDTVNSANWINKGRRIYHVETSATSLQFNMTNTNAWLDQNSPMDLKGMRRFYLLNYAYNSIGSNRGWCDWQVKYLPPAPSLLTYTDPGGEGAKNYSITFTGDTANNISEYHQANLTRTVRYKVGDASEWTYVVQDTQAALNANTTFTVRIPASQSAVIEGWMTYHDQQSATKTVNIFNGNAPSRVYGSVDGQSKLIQKLYASVGGQSVEVVKLYGSVDGKAKPILG